MLLLIISLLTFDPLSFNCALHSTQLALWGLLITSTWSSWCVRSVEFNRGRHDDIKVCTAIEIFLDFKSSDFLGRAELFL